MMAGGEKKKKKKKKEGGIERFPSRTRFQLIPRSSLSSDSARGRLASNGRWWIEENRRNVEIIL